MEENNTAAPQLVLEKKPSKIKNILLIVFVVLLIASNFVWILMFNKVSESNKKLNTTNAKLEEERLTNWRLLPGDFNVMFKLTDQTKNLVVGGDIDRSSVSLTTKDVIKAYESASKKDAKKALETRQAVSSKYSSSVASISRFKEKEIPKYSMNVRDGGNDTNTSIHISEYKKKYPKYIKKLGEYYYVFQDMTLLYEQNDNSTEMQQARKDGVSNAFSVYQTLKLFDGN